MDRIQSGFSLGYTIKTARIVLVNDLWLTQDERSVSILLLLVLGTIDQILFVLELVVAGMVFLLPSSLVPIGIAGRV